MCLDNSETAIGVSMQISSRWDHRFWVPSIPGQAVIAACCFLVSGLLPLHPAGLDSCRKYCWVLLGCEMGRHLNREEPNVLLRRSCQQFGEATTFFPSPDRFSRGESPDYFYSRRCRCRCMCRCRCSRSWCAACGTQCAKREDAVQPIFAGIS